MSNKQMTPDPKSKKGAMTIAIENNPCGRCRAAGYPTCKCGSGGGGSSGGESDESKKKDADFKSHQTTSISNQVKAAIKKFDEVKKFFVQSKLLSDKMINYETDLLFIESDRLRGNLSFRAKSGLSKDEAETIRQFLKIVKSEFESFKNCLAEQGVSTNGFNATLKDNELTIHIPNQKYYDAFIKHLENKNLLPIPNPEREVQKETRGPDKQQTFNTPNPFSTKLERK
jgi:hypothetical protein